MDIDTTFGNVTSKYVCNLLSSAVDIKIKYSKYGNTIKMEKSTN